MRSVVELKERGEGRKGRGGPRVGRSKLEPPLPSSKLSTSAPPRNNIALSLPSANSAEALIRGKRKKKEQHAECERDRPRTQSRWSPVPLSLTLRFCDRMLSTLIDQFQSQLTPRQKLQTESRVRRSKSKDQRPPSRDPCWRYLPAERFSCSQRK